MQKTRCRTGNHHSSNTQWNWTNILDVSNITVTSSGTTHTTTYTHPLDLIVHNTISAQIEPDTVLTFTADTSDNEDNFTVQYITDEHNDNVVQLGLDNVSYELTNHAIAITFERVSSSPTVYLRDNTNDCIHERYIIFWQHCYRQR